MWHCWQLKAFHTLPKVAISQDSQRHTLFFIYSEFHFLVTIYIYKLLQAFPPKASVENSSAQWAIFILNVRTGPGSKHHYHNPLGEMSESCQNPLGCMWGALGIHTGWCITCSIDNLYYVYRDSLIQNKLMYKLVGFSNLLVVALMYAKLFTRLNSWVILWTDL